MAFRCLVNQQMTLTETSPMPKITVIADTSCLIALSKIEAIELLRKLYEDV